MHPGLNCFLARPLGTKHWSGPPPLGSSVSPDRVAPPPWRSHATHLATSSPASPAPETSTSTPPPSATAAAALGAGLSLSSKRRSERSGIGSPRAHPSCKLARSWPPAHSNSILEQGPALTEMLTSRERGFLPPAAGSTVNRIRYRPDRLSPPLTFSKPKISCFGVQLVTHRSSSPSAAAALLSWGSPAPSSPRKYSLCTTLRFCFLPSVTHLVHLWPAALVTAT
mmetsp:Transcript_8955/g.32295  ORF Transcript_8955/g.32295 Transcript_8955/m.32295 type:complete len:225 (+) Transcript_8955:579-1253(+)